MAKLTIHPCGTGPMQIDVPGPLGQYGAIIDAAGMMYSSDQTVDLQHVH